MDLLDLQEALGSGDEYNILGVDANVKLNEEDWGSREELFVATVNGMRILPAVGHTHENYATGKKATIDYMVVSHNFDQARAEVDYAEANCSDHVPLVAVIRVSAPARSRSFAAFGARLWKNWRPDDVQIYKEKVIRQMQNGWKSMDDVARKVREVAYENKAKKVPKENEKKLQDMKQVRRTTQCAEARKNISKLIARLASEMKRERAADLITSGVFAGRVKEWRQSRQSPAKLPTKFEEETDATRWSDILEKRVRETMMVEKGSEEERELLGVLDKLRASWS